MIRPAFIIVTMLFISCKENYSINSNATSENFFKESIITSNDLFESISDENVKIYNKIEKGENIFFWNEDALKTKLKAPGYIFYSEKKNKIIHTAGKNYTMLDNALDTIAFTQLPNYNPEFSISPIPFELSDGFVYLDELYGLQSYKSDNSKLILNCEVNFDPPHYHKLSLDEKNNTFYLFQSDPKENKKLKKYNLSTCSLLKESQINENISQLSLNPEIDHFVYKRDNKVYISKDMKEALRINLPASDLSEVKWNGDNGIKAVFRNNNENDNYNILDYIFVENDSIREKVIKFDKKYVLSHPFVTGNYFGVIAYTTNTPGKYNNETKLHQPQAYIFKTNDYSVKSYKLESDEIILDAQESSGELYLTRNESLIKINLTF